MAAGDKLLLDTGTSDKLLLRTGSTDVLLIQAAAASSFQPAWAMRTTTTIVSGTTKRS